MKSKAHQLTGLCSLLINVLPFVVYPLLITQRDGQFINFLPFAIYYAFRRSAPILFRDWEHNYPSLGKIGLYSGLVGSFLGLFGTLNPASWDLSGVGVGLASALFPTAINQNKRLMKIHQNEKAKSSPWKLIDSLLIFLGMLAIIAICRSSLVSFASLFLINVIAFYGYQYRHHRLTKPVHFHWSNYLLGTILFLAMFSIRIALLTVFLLVMTILLITNWQGRFISPDFHRKSVFYGICGQYWMVYSTIFIGITYSIHLYYWTVVAYLLAMLFGPLFAKTIYHYFAIDQLSVYLIITILGIIMTFWLPTYCIGIFLICTFTIQVRQMAISEYEQQTNNYHLSYIVNNNYGTIGGMISQFVMWGSLFLLLHKKELSISFINFAQHRTSLNNIAAINGAHLILATFMILFSIWLLVDNIRLEHDKVDI